MRWRDIDVLAQATVIVDHSHYDGEEPALLAAAIGRLAPSARLAVLETGGQSSWLQRELSERGVPAVIVDARRAKAALSCRMNKTDANDAEGLAQLARTG